jgi:hypothetical protein
MNSANAKWQQLIAPAALGSSGATVNSNLIDTAGFDYLEVVLNQGAATASSTLAALQLQEGDSSSTVSAAVTGTIVGTSTALFNAAGGGSNLPSTATNNTLQLFNVDLKGRKRYQQLSLTLGGSSATYVDAVARLSRAERAPESAACSGANQVFQVPQQST